MASLYDLELQESNNFIHALAQNGKTPALKLIADQKQMAASMGDAGKELLKQFDDPNGEMAKGMARLQQLEIDIKDAMAKVSMTTDIADKANSIFSKSPETLTDLSPEEQEQIKDYWLKKKSVIVILLQKGYSHQELFS